MVGNRGAVELPLLFNADTLRLSQLKLISFINFKTKWTTTTSRLS
jgi:hypothetical protein